MTVRLADSATRMARRWHLLAWLLVILWIPATTHCHLENLFPNLTFLACGEEGHAGPHQAQDCQGDPCGAIESGHYLASLGRYQVRAPGFRVSLLTLMDEAHVAARKPAVLGLGRWALDPPGLGASWHFRLRAAPSPRAPSALL